MSFLSGPFHYWFSQGQPAENSPPSGSGAHGVMVANITGSVSSDIVTFASLVVPNAAGRNFVTSTPDNLTGLSLVQGTPWQIRFDIDAYYAAYRNQGKYGLSFQTYIRAVRGSAVALERFILNCRGATEAEGWIAVGNPHIAGPLSFAPTTVLAYPSDFSIPLIYHAGPLDPASYGASINFFKAGFAGGGDPAYSIANGTTPGTVTLGSNDATDPNYGGFKVPYQLPIYYSRYYGTSTNNPVAYETDVAIASVFPNLTLPVITSGDLTTAANTAVSYQITATNNPDTFTAKGLPPGLRVDVNSGSITGSPTQGGVFAVLLSATNITGTGNGTVTFTIRDATTPPPDITSGNATGQVGFSFDYQITATNDPTGYSAIGLPSGLTCSTTTGAISGKPRVPGTFPVVLGATNEGGHDNASVIFTIADIPPVLGEITSADAAGVVGTALTYQITATNSPTAFTATGLPPGLTLDPDTGAITGTPTLVDTFSVVLTATGTVGTATGTRTFVITGTGSTANPNCVILVNLITGEVGTKIPIAFPHGNQVIFQIQFIPSSQAGTLTDVGFILKEPGTTGLRQFGTLLESNDTSTAKDGTNGSIFILDPLAVTSPRLNRSLTLLDHIALRASVDYQAEVHFTWNGRHRTGNLFKFTVTRELYVVAFAPGTSDGSDVGSTISSYTFRRDIVAHTGGGPTALDGVTTLGLPTGIMLGFVVPAFGIEEHYQLRPADGTGYGGVPFTLIAGNTGVIQPADHSSINDRMWVKTE